MLSRIGCCLALVVLVGSSLSAETLQDRKLPSPAVFEAVFPQVVFGNLTPYGRYETVLILANPENREAQVELDFRYPDGQSALSFFTTNGAFAGLIGSFEDNGLFYVKIPAHAVQELAFPGKAPKLLPQDFNGWAVVRSNSRLFAHQALRVIDSRNVMAEVSYADGYTATTRAQIRVSNVKWESHGEGSGQWWGWNTLQSGITVVNPFSTSASIGLTLKGTRRGFELPPHTKRAFLISEEFPTFRGAFSYDMDTVLLVEAQTSTPFVILGLNTFIDTDPKGLPNPGTDRPWLTFSLPWGLDIPGGMPFSFPDQIFAEASLGPRQVVVSRLGFVVTGLDEHSHEVYPLNTIEPMNARGVISDQALGVAVVYGADDIPVVFAATGHVLRIPIGSYQKPSIMAGEKPGQVVVQFGTYCQIWRHTIDVQTETLVSSKSSYGWCL